MALPWRPTQQQWRVNGGYLTLSRGDSCSALQRADNYLITMDREWEEKNLPVDVSAQLYGNEGAAGFVVRAQWDLKDPYNKAMADHYLVVVDWSTYRMRVQRRGTGELRTPICNAAVPASVLTRNSWLSLRVLVDGSSFQVFIGTTRYCNVRDTAADALPAGSIGLYSDTPGAPPRFRDFTVRQIDEECRSGCTSMAEGETCTFTCQAPFIARGDATRTCQSSGAWSGSAVGCGYPVPTVSNQAREILEESDENTAVGSPLTATTATGLEIQFEIVSGNTGNAFSVSSCTGQLRVATPASIDFESSVRSFTLTMRAMTEGDADAGATFTVTVDVLDQNEPPVFAAQTRSIDENVAAGTNAGAALTATDPDGDSIVWSIELGNAGNAFTISSTGQLQAGSSTPSPLDFESIPVWRIVVRAANVESQDGTDVVVASTDATITINLNDVNEAPVASNLTVSLLETFGQQG